MTPRVVSPRYAWRRSARTKGPTIGPALLIILGSQYHVGIEITHMRFGRGLHACVDVEVVLPRVFCLLLMAPELF